MLSPEQFASALVERLAAILPAGFTARADDDGIWIDAPDGLGAATNVESLLDHDEPEPEDYASAAWNVLSLAQDVVSETTSDPWPAAIGPGTDLAEPGTRVEGGTIALWFGAEDQPVLTLRPIEIEVRSER